MNNNEVNKFGDGISWENHIQEILNRENIVYYNSQSNPEKIKKLKEYKQNGKVLDCGCHIGRWINIFEGNGYDYTGVDQSEQAIKTAKIYQPNGKFIHSLLWEMKFDEEFDILFTNAVLQHNTLEEQEKIISKIYQSLKHDGILFITESTVNNETETQRTYSGWINIMKKYGFKFMESFHKNELGLNDNYIFIKN